MEEESVESVVAKVRSCLISVKGLVTMKQLESDYRLILGESIPYRKLGYRSLEDFLVDIPTIITCRNSKNELLIDAQDTEKTAHISELVRKQKPVAPKKRPPVTSRHNNRRLAVPPPVAAKWRPKQKPFLRRPFENRPRLPPPPPVAHHPNQAQHQYMNGVGVGYNKPTVASKVVVVPPPPPPKKEENIEKSVQVNSSNSTEKPENSLFSSSLKRISKIMSGMNMETDSGMSSPSTDHLMDHPVNLGNVKLNGEFVKTGDPISDIRNFAAYHKLGEVIVNFSQIKPKNSKQHQIHCKITVGQHKYSSYPEDFFDTTAAQRQASQKALDDLMQKYSRRKSLLLSSNEDILKRIPPMLEEQHNICLWMWQIEADYIEKYNEQLPPDWLQIIDSSPFVAQERCQGGIVLKYCNPDDKGKKLDLSLNVLDVSVPRHTFDFGESNRIYAIVTAAHSTEEIWCQRCGTPEYDKFSIMSDNMAKFYSHNKKDLKTKQVFVGSCYVIQQDELWFRVRALSDPVDGIVHFFLIDYGEELYAPIENIYVLRSQFAMEQAQAFACSLDGLAEFRDVSRDSEHLAALIGNEYILERVTDEINDTSNKIIPVVLYDPTSHASINEELISLLTAEQLAAVPILEKGTLIQVYVSNIESNGDIYVQIRTVGYYTLMENLENLLKKINENTSDPKLKPTKSVSPDKIYLVESKMSKQWLRGTFLDWSPCGNFAQVYFIDKGTTDVFKINQQEVYELENIDKALSQYPAQAIKVRFMIETIPTDFVDKVEKLLRPDEPVLLKVICHDNENVSWVEFFKRTSDGVLVFINKSISVEAELQQSRLDMSNNNEVNRKKLSLQFNDCNKNVPSGGFLRKPELPKIGGYFNVNIPFAVNPYNFFIQPLDSFAELKALMNDMQEFYKDIQFSPMPLEDIVPGRIYASKHEDGQWYRTNVMKVIHGGSISVFYCDFGYYTSLRSDQLVPIEEKYMTLPYQALKAKIAGIKPFKSKWTMEDCEIFKELVMKKPFVSVIVNIEKDEFHKSDSILELLLIDTASDEDVHIKDILIAKEIAISV